jgi:hypothetical protein
MLADFLWEKNIVPAEKTSWIRQIISQMNRVSMGSDAQVWATHPRGNPALAPVTPPRSGPYAAHKPLVKSGSSPVRTLLSSRRAGAAPAMPQVPPALASPSCFSLPPQWIRLLSYLCVGGWPMTARRICCCYAGFVLLATKPMCNNRCASSLVVFKSRG